MSRGVIMEVFVDTREPSSIVKSGRVLYPHLIEKKLDYGDVMFVKDKKCICIERKKPADFASSCVSGRMYNQAINLRNACTQSVIVITGSYDDIKNNKYIKNFSKKKWNSHILSLILRYGVPIVFADNDNKFWDKCAEIERIGYKETPLARREVKKSSDNVYVDMLCAIPSIGEKRAISLLNAFDFTDIFFLDVKDLMKIQGIGKKRAKEIKRWMKMNGRLCDC